MAEGKTIRAKVLAARKKMADPRKSGENPHFGSKFVPRDAVLDVVVPALLEQGLWLSQGLLDGQLVTSVHDDTDTLDLGSWPVAPNSDPQRYMAATTYASRGSLMLAFALAGDEDDDGNAAAAAPKDTSAEDFGRLMQTAEKFGTKAAVGDKLGNPKTQQAALKAYRALPELDRAALLFIAEGASEA